MSISSFLDPAACERLVLALAHFLWQGAAVALALRLAGPILRAAPARVRYRVLVGSLFLLALCPPANFAVLGRSGGGPTGLAPEAPASLSPPATDLGVPERVEALPVSGPAPRAEARSSLSAIAPSLAILYLAGVTLMLGRLVLALGGARRLRRKSEPVGDPVVLEVLERKCREIGLAFRPAIAFCREVAVPTVVGVLRPAILLPWSMMSGLSPEQIEMLVTHELAHIRRLDPLVNLLQGFLEAVLFFHPAVWHLSKRIRIEREFLCDELVLASGGKAQGYAGLLVDVARLACLSGAAPLGQATSLGAVSSGSRLRERIVRILDGGAVRPARLGSLPRLFLAAIALSTIAGIAWPIGCNLHGKAGGDGADDEVAATASIQVTVTAADTGQPVAEYRLQVTDQEPFHAHLSGNVFKVKDGEGKHLVEDIPPGTCQLGVKAKGYAVLWKPLTLKEGEKQDLYLVLARGTSVWVRVVAADSGEPIAGAEVEYITGSKPLVYYNDPDQQDGQVLDNDRAFTTGADGRCRIDCLTDDSYDLSFRRKGFFREVEDIKVKIPADAGKEFQARLIANGALRGRVAKFVPADFEKAPYLLVLQMVAKGGGTLNYEIAVDSKDGDFHREELHPGSYQLFWQPITLEEKVPPAPVKDGEVREGALPERDLKPLTEVVIQPGKTKELEVEAPAAEETVDRERKANDEAFRTGYTPRKALFISGHTGQWVAIAGGEVLPNDGKGNILPVRTIDECLSAAAKKHPGARHRYVFRIGEEGDEKNEVGNPSGANVVGVGLHLLLGLDTSTYSTSTMVTTWRRGGKVKTFPMGKVAEMEVSLSEPAGKSVRAVRVTDSTGFTGVALFEPELAQALRLTLYEIPGTLHIDGGQKFDCRRAHARIAIPDLDVDLVIPVGVWIHSDR